MQLLYPLVALFVNERFAIVLLQRVRLGGQEYINHEKRGRRRQEEEEANETTPLRSSAFPAH